ncbi:MAG: TIGR04211 family SH3 domain-containing protein [Deltaproteobacteria bacterium]|nr:TIGR04211 family SH3 domain-containing protein [Deltaproteobacteria bacterium]
MKYILSMAVIIFMLVPATVKADSAFVNDIMEITMRLGPGRDFKVIRTLSSGNGVEVLESKKGWARVRAKDGATGWVVARYLTKTEPASRAAQQTRDRLDELSAKQDALLAENAGLVNEKKGLEQKLADTSARLEKTATELSDLREESKGFLELKAGYDKCSATIEKQSRRIAVLEREVRSRWISTGIKWFLAGAGVLLVGILMGLSSRRKRPMLR